MKIGLATVTRCSVLLLRMYARKISLLKLSHSVSHAAENLALFPLSHSIFVDAQRD